ncbi:hypothetical protein [Arthrobacter sp. MDT1-65]
MSLIDQRQRTGVGATGPEVLEVDALPRAPSARTMNIACELRKPIALSTETRTPVAVLAADLLTSPPGRHDDPDATT